MRACMCTCMQPVLSYVHGYKLIEVGADGQLDIPLNYTLVPPYTVSELLGRSLS